VLLYISVCMCFGVMTPSTYGFKLCVFPVVKLCRIYLHMWHEAKQCSFRLFMTEDRPTVLVVHCMKCPSMYWHVPLHRTQSSLKVSTEKVAPCFSGLLASVQSPEAALEFSVFHCDPRIDSSQLCRDLFILKPYISWATGFISEGVSHLFYTLGYVNAEMFTHVHVLAFLFAESLCLYD